MARGLFLGQGVGLAPLRTGSVFLMIDLVVMACLVATGALCGWWLRGGVVAGSPQRRDSGTMNVTLRQLRSIAEDVAENLGEHHHRMQEIHVKLQKAAQEGPDEILAVVSQLIDSNEAMQKQLHSAEEKLQHQAEEIESRSEEARTDALTRLSNRRAFDVAMSESARRFEEDQVPTSLLMLDVDHFKRFNDRYGHPAGDAVLRGVAKVLAKQFGTKGEVCRYGGEEFAVVFSGQTCQDIAELVDEARKEITRSRFAFEGKSFQITCSSGLAEFRSEDDCDSVISRADEALYHSKKVGRNCGHWHDGRRVRPIRDAWTRRKRNQKDDVGAAEVDLEKTDFSAGISTEAVFVADVDRRLADFRRGNGTKLSVLFARIDDFETIKSEYGDGAARAVTRAATMLFKATMRDMDHVAEFEEGTLSLMLPGANLEGAASVAERLREAAGRCRLPQRRFPPERFTFTVGVAEADLEEDGESLMDRVQDIVREGGQQNRNCTFVHADGKCRLIGTAHVSLAKVPSL